MANDISKIKLPGSTIEYTLKDGSAVANITRSGTTFTATRRNGTTFTFTQQDNNTTYTLAAGTGDDASKIILTPSSGTANKITVPYATKATQDSDGNTIKSTYLKLSGGTMTGALTMAGTDIQLKTIGSSYDDSSDIVWYYGNGQEKARLWTQDAYTAKGGLNYRVYKKDGTSLYNGTIPLADGTGASGTWSITAAIANKLGSANVGSATQPIYLSAGTATACTYTLGKSVPSNAVFTDTNTTYTLSADTANNKIKLTPSSGDAQSITVPYASIAGSVSVPIVNPELGTYYSPIFGYGGVGDICLYRRNDYYTYFLKLGTTSAVGESVLHIGNAISSGADGNSRGGIVLYSEGSGKSFLRMTNVDLGLTYNHYLPAVDGTIGVFTATPTSGQVVVTDGTVGGFKTTGYTIAKSVPSNAVFTDTNVTQTATSTNANYEVLFSATADNTTRTEGARKNSNLIFNPVAGLKIGTSSQSAFPTTGIQVHDVRSVNFTPGALDQGVNFFFSNNTMPNGNWWSGIHIKGWTGAYAAWEIVGSAHNNDSRTTPLYVRSSNTNSAWGSWRKIYDTSNPPTKSEVGLGNVDNTADANKSVASATTATKLSANAGSATNPVYFTGGVPTACTYSLNKTVPSDAVFTDTNNKVTQTATTTSATYELLFSATADNTTRTEGARKTDSLKYNPSTKELTLDGTVVLNGYSRSTSTDPCPSLILKANNIDTDTAVTARVWGNSELNAHDKDGDRIGFINWFKDADGSIGVAFAAQNKSTGGTSYHNTLEMRVDKTGNRAYSVTDTKAFRTAINDTTITFTKSTTALSGNIGVTRKGNVCTITIGNQITTAGTYTQLGTISPKPAMSTHFLVALDGALRIMRVQADGSVVFNNATAVSANAWLIGSCTYITAD